MVATILKDATAEESNKQKEKEYAERRSKVYSRVEFASFVLQKSPLEDEFCVYDVQKEGDEGDDASSGAGASDADALGASEFGAVRYWGSSIDASLVPDDA